MWIETGLSAISLVREQPCTVHEISRIIALAKDMLNAGLEVQSMRAQYFKDIVVHGFEQATQMSFLVEQGQ